MLADDFTADVIAFLGDFAKRRIPASTETIEDYAIAVTCLKDATKFVLSDSAMEIVADIAQDARGVGSSSDRLVGPHDMTWIEWADELGRCGVCMTIDEDGVGAGFFTRDTPPKGVPPFLFPFRLDRTATGLSIGFESADPTSSKMLDLALEAVPQAYRTPALTAMYSSAQNADTLDAMRRRTIAALALINSRRIADPMPADVGKVNRARKRRSRPPLFAYSTVVIRPGLDPTGKPSHAAAGGEGGRALYKVRAHFRLRLGKVEIVRSHWRGDEANGVRLHDYRIEA